MDNNNTPTQTAARPGMLTVLCILSMIANALGGLVWLLLLVAASTITAMLPDSLSGMLWASLKSKLVCESQRADHPK